MRFAVAQGPLASDVMRGRGGPVWPILMAALGERILGWLRVENRGGQRPTTPSILQI